MEKNFSSYKNKFFLILMDGRMRNGPEKGGGIKNLALSPWSSCDKSRGRSTHRLGWRKKSATKEKKEIKSSFCPVHWFTIFDPNPSSLDSHVTWDGNFFFLAHSFLPSLAQFVPIDPSTRENFFISTCIEWIKWRFFSLSRIIQREVKTSFPLSLSHTLHS